MVTLTPATNQLVTAAELRAHSNLPAVSVPGASTDSQLNSFLIAAQQRLERETKRIFGVRSVEQTAILDVENPAPVPLACYPLGAITVQRLQGGVWVTLAQTAWELASNQTVNIFDVTNFDSHASGAPNLRLTYSTGETLPEMGKLAILNLAAHFFENREATSNLQTYTVPLSYQSTVDLMESHWGVR